MKRRLSFVFKQLKRKIVVSIAGDANPQRQAVVSLCLLALTELALLTLTFCTNFLSAYIHNTLEVFHNFRLRSLANAQNIVAFERSTGLFFEQRLQQWHETHLACNEGAASPSLSPSPSPVADYVPLASGDSPYYAPEGASAVAFGDLSPAQQYRFLRAVWVLSAWVSFLGFLFIPTMPPRLLPVCDFLNALGANVGACLTIDFSFIDSIGAHGSLLWDWNDEAVKTLNNPYAAFPSQHTIFAAWCAIAWIKLIGPASPALSVSSSAYWLRALMRWAILLYPMATIYCIVITANHYISDALGGLVVLAFSYAPSPILHAPDAQLLRQQARSVPSTLPY
ncbi:hypothetical protein BX661DRAFT_184803 [Kickxella alabastrina]|uniref:uncharacterized protein n=1 Tax=Kickxella alabastrina TaxID=61397 RepID=UPI002220D3EE|nr:uncharacterized protein BX661DRAFT_184803 [Kickxella alabastrina]KAI7825549.1 hypothetical protein BX661DRAFT_184803 [Kickxella alabastrina]